MPRNRSSGARRDDLLAEVSELYYLEEKTQAEIAKAIGVTRSMVSRMLKEARERGIVEIRVNRPLQSDHDLETGLRTQFDLVDSYVVANRSVKSENLLKLLGAAGAQVLMRYLEPDIVLGIAWGTSISATVDAVDVEEPMPLKVVQLVGALGARNAEYDGHDLVLRLANKLGGEAYFLNAPFICQSPEVARSLMENDSIRETVNMGKQARLALLGIGSAWPEYSSFYRAGYVPIEELNHLREMGAVGDVCGIHFDANGGDACLDFCERLVTIKKTDLLAVPIRIGVAGGPGKVESILGALRGGYINVLVTDSITARKLLDLERRE